MVFGRVLLSLVVATLAVPVSAGDWVRDVNGWSVGRSSNTCIMLEEYEGEGSTNFALVIRDPAQNTYVMVTNYRWSDEDDRQYELRYQLGEWVHTLPSYGIEQDIIRKGFVTVVGHEFLSDFAKADDIEIFNGATLVDDLSLDGSAAALDVLERCRTELSRDIEEERRNRERLQHIPVDPFAPDAAPVEPPAENPTP